nr:putative ulp1 protease family, C-terminal catalytic domain-containing protein [Ipomoea batatas]
MCINEVDVLLALGFPRGDLKIEKWPRAHNTDLLEEWKWLVDRSSRGYLYDNSSKTVSNDQKYGKVSANLKNMVINYLKSEGLDAKFDRFKSVKPTRIKMSWRHNENKENCGVYVMRHMKTFMGSLAKEWECGLERGNRSELE